MSESIIKVLVHLDFPSGMQDDEQSAPPVSRPAGSFSELEQIVRDGCGATFTYRRYDHAGSLRSSSDIVYLIEEV